MRTTFLWCLLCVTLSFGQGIGGKAGMGGKGGVGGGATAAPPTFTEKTPSHNYACTTNPCTVTLSQSIASGDLVTIETNTLNTVAPISISAGGTVTPCFPCVTGDTSDVGSISGAYIYPATAASTSVAVTMSGAVGSTNYEIVIRDFTVNNGGTVLPDSFTNEYNLSETSPYSGVAIGTLTGSSDSIIQQTATNWGTPPPTVGSPWDTNALFGTGGGDRSVATGYVSHVNTTSTTPPTFTLSGSGHARNHSMAFGFNGTACTDQDLIDFAGGTATNNITTGTLNTAGNSGTWGAASGSPASALTFQTAAHNNLLTSFSSCFGHKTGSGTLGAKFDTSATVSYYFPYVFDPIYDSVSSGQWYVAHIGTSDTGYYSFSGFVNFNGSDSQGTMLHLGELYLETNVDPNGNPEVCTGASCNGNNKFSYAQDTLYWITMQYNKYVANGTSVTSLAIGTGSKTFTTQAGLGYVAGQVISASNSNTNWMVGTVTSYSGTSLVINSTLTGGSGTLASWTFSGSKHQMSIYDSSGTLLLNMQKPAQWNNPTQSNQYNLGRGGDSGTTAGSYIYTDNIKISRQGIFPLLP